MDRLSLVLTLMSGSVLVGSFLIIVLSLGLYDWIPITLAIVLGLALAWPVAYIISRWIKHDDPYWKMRSGKRGSRDDNRPDYPET